MNKKKTWKKYYPLYGTSSNIVLTMMIKFIVCAYTTLLRGRVWVEKNYTT